MNLNRILTLIFTMVALGSNLFASENVILNSGFESQWGSGNLLARYWERNPADNQYAYATSVAYAGSGAVYCYAPAANTTAEWISERVAVEPGETVNASVRCLFYQPSASGNIKMQVVFYTWDGNGSIVTTLNVVTTGFSSGTWSLLSSSITVPPSAYAAEMHIGLYNASLASFALFDEANLTRTNNANGLINRIINPGFEGLNSTYPSYWRRNTSQTFAGYTSSIAHTGSYSVYIRQTTNNAANREWYATQTTSSDMGLIAVDTAKLYRFGGWFRWAGVTTGNAGVRIVWFTASEDTISVQSLSVISTQSAHWLNLDSGAIPPPAGASAAQVRLFNFDTTSPDPILYADDVYFYETTENNKPLKLKLLTWNIQHGEGIDSNYDLNRIADYIADQNPDVVGLNEVYEPYTNLDYQLTTIKNRIQTRLGGTWYSVFGSNVDYVYVHMGNGLISRYPISSSQNHSILPQLGSEQRGCLEAHLNCNGTTVNIFLTHWAHDTEAERILSAQSCLIWMSQVTGPAILMGDLNSRHYSTPVNIMKSGYVDSIGTNALGNIYTVSNPSPTQRIDHIFMPSCKVIGESQIGYYDDATVASDHRPAMAVFWYSGSLLSDSDYHQKIANPSFEYYQGSFDTVVGWTKSINGFLPQITTLAGLTSESHHGLYAAYARSTGGGEAVSWTSRFMPVTGNLYYNSTTWLKWEGVASGSFKASFLGYVSDSNAYYLDSTNWSYDFVTTGSSSGWYPLVARFQIPAGTSALRIRFTLTGVDLSAIAMMDHLSLTCESASENLVINNGFESGDDGGGGAYGAYWRRSTGINNGRQDLTVSYAGNASYRINHPVSSSVLYREAYPAYALPTSASNPIIIPSEVDPAKQYQLIFMLNQFASPTSTAGYTRGGVILRWMDSTDAVISDITVYRTASNNTALSGWLSVSTTLTPPSDAFSIHPRIFLQNTQSVSTAWFDNIQFYEETVTVPVELSSFMAEEDELPYLRKELPLFIESSNEAILKKD